jgi:hypothetical protein
MAELGQQREAHGQPTATEQAAFDSWLSALPAGCDDVDRAAIAGFTG